MQGCMYDDRLAIVVCWT